MSIPVATYKCTACNFSCWNAFTWGYRYYLYGGTQVRMQVARGWCNACDDLCAIEELPTAAGEAEIRQRLIALQEELEKALGAAPRRRFWWQRIARATPQQASLQSEINSAKSELADYQLRRAALSTRTTQARCLRCGSENCTPLPPHHVDYYGDGSPVLTGFTHPGCGGELFTVCDGTRLHLLLHEKAYDLDGHERVADQPKAEQ